MFKGFVLFRYSWIVVKVKVENILKHMDKIKKELE